METKFKKTVLTWLAIVAISSAISVAAKADGAGGDGGGVGDGGNGDNNSDNLGTEYVPIVTPVPAYNPGPSSPPTKTGTAEASHQPVAVSSPTSTVTHTQTTAASEPVQAKVVRLDEEGETSFAGGVVRVAMGINQLSDAEAERAAEGDTPGVKQARNDALHAISDGTAKIADGRSTVAHSNAIRANENRLRSLGAGGGMPMHELTFESDRLAPAAAESLQNLEKNSGVSPQALIDAASSGNMEEIARLAAGAKNVSLTDKDILSVFPNFATSTAQPSAPVADSSFVAPISNRPGDVLAPENKSKAFPYSGDSRVIASSETGNKDSLGGKSNFSNLEKDPINTTFGSIQASAEFGDPDKDLFQRVRRQYKQRMNSLRSKSSKAL